MSSLYIQFLIPELSRLFPALTTWIFLQAETMSGSSTPKTEEKDVSLLDETVTAAASSAPSSPTKQETSPPPVKGGAGAAPNGKYTPQLIGGLPRAETEALRTFETLKDNHYQYGTLGRSKETLESLTCDCQYEHGRYNFPLSS